MSKNNPLKKRFKLNAVKYGIFGSKIIGYVALIIFMAVNQLVFLQTMGTNASPGHSSVIDICFIVLSIVVSMASIVFGFIACVEVLDL